MGSDGQGYGWRPFAAVLLLVAAVLLSACIELKPVQGITSGATVTIAQAGADACPNPNDLVCGAFVKAKREQLKSYTCYGFDGPSSYATGSQYGATTYTLPLVDGWTCSQELARKTVVGSPLSDSKSFTLDSNSPSSQMSAKLGYSTLLYGLENVTFNCTFSYDIYNNRQTSLSAYAFFGASVQRDLNMPSSVGGDLCDDHFRNKKSKPFSLSQDKLFLGGGGYDVFVNPTLEFSMNANIIPQCKRCTPLVCVDIPLIGEQCDGHKCSWHDESLLTGSYSLTCTPTAEYTLYWRCEKIGLGGFRYVNCTDGADTLRTFQGGKGYIDPAIPSSELGGLLQSLYTDPNANKIIPFFMLGQGPTFNDFESARSDCSPFEERKVQVSLGNSTFDPPEMRAQAGTAICFDNLDVVQHNVTITESVSRVIVSQLRVDPGVKQVCTPSLTTGVYIAKDSNLDELVIAIMPRTSSDSVVYIGSRLTPDYAVAQKGNTIAFNYVDGSGANHSITTNIPTAGGEFSDVIGLSNPNVRIVPTEFGEFIISDNVTKTKSSVFVGSAENAFVFDQPGAQNGSLLTAQLIERVSELPMINESTVIPGDYVARPYGDRVCFSSKVDGLTIDIQKESGGEFKTIENRKLLAEYTSLCCMEDILPGLYRATTSDGRTVNWLIGSRKPSATIGVQPIGFVPPSLDIIPNTKICLSNPVAIERWVTITGPGLNSKLHLDPFKKDDCRTKIVNEGGYSIKSSPIDNGAICVIDAAAEKTKTIKILDLGFDPTYLQAKPGKDICWLNAASTPQVLVETSSRGTQRMAPLAKGAMYCERGATDGAVFVQIQESSGLASVATVSTTPAFFVLNGSGIQPTSLSALSAGSLKFVNTLSVPVKLSDNEELILTNNSMSKAAMSAITPMVINVFNKDTSTHVSTQYTTIDTYDPVNDTTNTDTVEYNESTTNHTLYLCSGNACGAPITIAGGSRTTIHIDDTFNGWISDYTTGKRATINVTKLVDVLDDRTKAGSIRTVPLPNVTNSFTISSSYDNSTAFLSVLPILPTTVEQTLPQETLDLAVQKTGYLTSEQLARMRDYADRGIVSAIVPSFKNLTVNIRTSLFDPISINTTAGSRVTIRNMDNIPHNIEVTKETSQNICVPPGIDMDACFVRANDGKCVMTNKEWYLMKLGQTGAISSSDVSCRYDNSSGTCESKLLNASTACSIVTTKKGEPYCTNNNDAVKCAYNNATDRCSSNVSFDYILPTSGLCKVVPSKQVESMSSGTSATLYDIYLSTWGGGFIRGSKGNGWAVGTEGTILKTTDGGTTWTRKNSNTTQTLKAVQIISTGGSDTTYHYPDTVGYAVGAGGTVTKTTDGGSTWNSTPPTLPPSDLKGVYGKYAVGSGGALIKTTDDGMGNIGVIWALGSSGTTSTLRAVASDNGAHYPNDWIMVAGDSGTLRFSKDSGTTWTAMDIGTSANLRGLFTTAFNCVYSDCNYIGYAVGAGGTIINMTGWGDSFTVQSGGTPAAPAPTIGFTSVSFANNSTAYSVSPLGLISKSSDSALTWSPLASGTTSNLLSMSFAYNVNPNVGMAVGDNGLMLKTTDSGATWTSKTYAPVSGAPSGDIYDMQFLNATYGFAVGAGGKIYKTMDGGVTWIMTQAASATTNLYGVYFATDTTLNGKNGWAVGDGGTILYTRDGGMNWNRFNRALPTSNTLYSIYVQYGSYYNDFTLYAVGASGTFIYTTWRRSDEQYWYVSSYGPYSWTTYPVCDTAGNTVTDKAVRKLSTQSYAVGDGGMVLGWGYCAGSVYGFKMQSLPTFIPAANFSTYNSGLIGGSNGVILGPNQTAGASAKWTREPILDRSIGTGTYNYDPNAVLLTNENVRSIIGSPAPSGTYGAAVGDNGAFYVRMYADFWNCCESGCTVKPSKLPGFTYSYGECWGYYWVKNASLTSSNLYAYSAANSTTMYAAGAGGTFLKTMNGGNTWSVPFTVPTPPNLKSVSMLSATTAYAAGSRGTVINTTDGGTTWTPENVGTTSAINGISASSNTWVVAVGDGGMIARRWVGTWSSDPALTTQNLNAVSTLYKSGYYYSFVTGNNGAFLTKFFVNTPTENSWTNWSISAAQGSNLYSVTAWNDNYNVYAIAVGSNGMIVRYLKALSGGTETVSVVPSCTTANLRSVTVVNQSYATYYRNVLYVFGDGGVIMKSIDSGGSWQPLSLDSTKDLNAVALSSVGGGTPIAAAVGDGGTVRVYRSVDGPNWQTKYACTNKNLNAITPITIIPNSPSDDFLAAGDNGTVVISDGYGYSWGSKKITDKNLYGVYINRVNDVGVGIAVGANGAVLNTSDSGKTWSNMTVPSSVSAVTFRSVYSADLGNWYAVGDGGVIIHATYSSYSKAFSQWTVVSGGGMFTPTMDLNGVSFWSLNEGYAVGNGGTILYTTNGGAVWNQDASGVTSNLQAVQYSLPYGGSMAPIAVGDGGVILKKGGSTWTRKASGLTTSALYGIDFYNSNTGLIVGDGGTILRTTDGGETWTAIPAASKPGMGAAWLWKVAYRTEGGIAIAVGSGGQMFISFDDGLNWTKMNSDTTNGLYGVGIVPDDGTAGYGSYIGFATGNWGTILRTLEYEPYACACNEVSYYNVENRTWGNVNCSARVDCQRNYYSSDPPCWSGVKGGGGTPICSVGNAKDQQGNWILVCYSNDPANFQCYQERDSEGRLTNTCTPYYKMADSHPGCMFDPYHNCGAYYSGYFFPFFWCSVNPLIDTNDCALRLYLLDPTRPDYLACMKRQDYDSICALSPQYASFFAAEAQCVVTGAPYTCSIDPTTGQQTCAGSQSCSLNATYRKDPLQQLCKVVALSSGNSSYTDPLLRLGENLTLSNLRGRTNYTATETPSGSQANITVESLDATLSVTFSMLFPIMGETSPYSFIQFNNYDTKEQSLGLEFSAAEGGKVTKSVTVAKYTNETGPGKTTIISADSLGPSGNGSISISSPELGTAVINVSDSPMRHDLNVSDAGFGTKSLAADINSKVCFRSLDNERKINIYKDGKLVTEGTTFGTEAPIASTYCSTALACSSIMYGVSCNGTLNSTNSACRYTVLDPTVGCAKRVGTGCTNAVSGIVCAYENSSGLCMFKGDSTASSTVCGGNCVPRQAEAGAVFSCSKAGNSCGYSYNSGMEKTSTSNIFCNVFRSINDIICQPTGMYSEIGCTSKIGSPPSTRDMNYCYLTPPPQASGPTAVSNQYCTTIPVQNNFPGNATCPAQSYYSISSSGSACVVNKGGSSIGDAPYPISCAATTGAIQLSCGKSISGSVCQYSAKSAQPYLCQNDVTCPCIKCEKASQYSSAGNIQCVLEGGKCDVVSQFQADASGTWCRKTTGDVCVSNYPGVKCGGPGSDGSCQMAATETPDTGSTKLCVASASGCEQISDNVNCAFNTTTSSCEVTSFDPSYCWDSAGEGNYVIEDATTLKSMSIKRFNKNKPLEIDLKKSAIIPNLVYTSPGSSVCFISGDGKNHSLLMSNGTTQKVGPSNVCTCIKRSCAIYGPSNNANSFANSSVCTQMYEGSNEEGWHLVTKCGNYIDKYNDPINIWNPLGCSTHATCFDVNDCKEDATYSLNRYSYVSSPNMTNYQSECQPSLFNATANTRYPNLNPVCYQYGSGPVIWDMSYGSCAQYSCSVVDKLCPAFPESATPYYVSVTDVGSGDISGASATISSTTKNMTIDVYQRVFDPEYGLMRPDGTLTFFNKDAITRTLVRGETESRAATFSSPPATMGSEIRVDSEKAYVTDPSSQAGLDKQYKCDWVHGAAGRQTNLTLTLPPGTLSVGVTSSFNDNGAIVFNGYQVPGTEYTLCQSKLYSSTGSVLNWPNSASKLSNGDVLIADTGNHRVVEVSAGGTVVWKYGTDGICANQANYLCRPTSAQKLSNGNVLIADSSNNRVIEVRPTGSSGGTIVSTLNDPSQVSTPYYAERISGSTAVVNQGSNSAIKIGGTCGTFLVCGAYGCSSYTTDICYPFTFIYQILGYSGQTGTFGLNRPSGGQLTSRGTMIVADTGNNRVVDCPIPSSIIYVADPPCYFRYGGSAGSGPGQLRAPNGASTATSAAGLIQSGDVIITDTGNHRVIAVRPSTGEIVWQYGTTADPGLLANQLFAPSDARQLANGNILITDSGNQRVIEVQPSGSSGGTIAWQYGEPVDVMSKPSYATIPTNFINPLGIMDNKVTIDVCNCGGGYKEQVTFVYTYLASAGLITGSQSYDIAPGDSVSITGLPIGTYAYLVKGQSRAFSLKVKECEGNDVSELAGRIGNYERSDYAPPANTACDFGDQADCKKYNPYGPATIAILSTEEALNFSDPAEIQCAKDQITTIKAACPNCTTALNIGQGDDSLVQSLLSDPSVAGSTDILARSLMMNDMPNCSFPDIMNSLINQSKFSLYTYKKPSVILDFGFKNGSNRAGTCSWNNDSISQAYDDLFLLWTAQLSGSGIIGISQTCYEDPCPLRDFYGFYNQDGTPKEYTNAWFKKGCGNYYYGGEGLTLATFAMNESMYSLCDPSKVFAMLQSYMCTLGGSGLKLPT